MKWRGPAETGFRSALLWSLLIHAGLLGLIVGMGGVLTPQQSETKLEWVWSAPQSTPQLAPPPVSATPAAPAASPVTSAANPATASPVTPVPTTLQTVSPQATGAQPVPPKPVSPTTPPPVFNGPLDDAPSGTGYAIVPPRLRERPLPAIPPALANVTGEVLLQVEVLADGRVGASRVVRSSGRRDLDELARQYVAGWSFQPAWQPQANKPVRVLTSVWVQFGTKKE